MNLRFWKKKKTPDGNPTEAGSKDEGRNDPAGEPPADPDNEPLKPSLVARLKGVLAKVVSFRKRKPQGEEEASETIETPARIRQRNAKAEEEETPPPVASSKKKRLLLMLLVLLAAGIGVAAWKLLPGGQPKPAPTPPTPQAEAAPAKRPGSEAQPFSAPITAPGSPPPAAEATPPAQSPGTAEAAAASAETGIQAQLEALKKQNQEMQAQIEMLKQQQGGTGQPAKSGASAPPHAGVLVIGGKNNKESAQSLKQVIEDMNATSEKSAPKK